MKKLDVQKATEIRYGYIACPHCDRSQDEIVNDETETGIYKCGEPDCGHSFLVNQELLDKGREVSSQALDERINDLARRVTRLEKELGVK